MILMGGQISSDMKTNKQTSKSNKKFLTIDELIIFYESCLHAEGKSPKTVKSYIDILERFLLYLKQRQHSISVSNLNIKMVREYIIHLRTRQRYDGHPYIETKNESLSSNTVNDHIRALKAFSTWLFSEGYTSDNRLMSLKLLKVPRTIIEPLTPEEIAIINHTFNIRTFTGFRNYLIFILALDSGLRASGLAGIRLGNVNLEGGYIKVMEKGAKERIVPVGKFVTSKMLHYIDQIRPLPIEPECDHLFLSPKGRSITANTIKLIFSRLAKKSGVTRLHAHLCRHTFAINYLLNGGDIFSLKEILGHSSLDMVNRYLRFTSTQITELHHQYSPIDHLQKMVK